MFKQDKKEFRVRYKRLRDGIPLFKREEWSLKIGQRLFQLDAYRNAKIIGVYMSIGSEVSTSEIIKRCWIAKKIVAAPKTNKKHHTLSFYPIKNLNDYDIGPYHILEPKKTGTQMDFDEIDLLLVPGIVFDKEGYRLGYGKGYYDRLLKKRKKGTTFGLTFEKNLIAHLPHAKNDIRVSTIITEKKVYDKTRHSGESRNLVNKPSLLDSGLRRNDG